MDNNQHKKTVWGIDFEDGGRPRCLDENKKEVFCHARWFRKVFKNCGKFRVIKVTILWED
jgi:hypothetical protein